MSHFYAHLHVLIAKKWELQSNSQKILKRRIQKIKEMQSV